MSAIDRLLIVLGALAGLTGVGLSAAAAHLAGGAGLVTPANFLLWHAPVPVLAALLAELGLGNRWLARAAGLIVVAGLALFCGSLTMVALKGVRLFGNAAPVGGILLMAGWAMLAVAALMGKVGPGRANRGKPASGKAATSRASSGKGAAGKGNSDRGNLD